MNPSPKSAAIGVKRDLVSGVASKKFLRFHFIPCIDLPKYVDNQLIAQPQACDGTRRWQHATAFAVPRKLYLLTSLPVEIIFQAQSHKFFASHEKFVHSWLETKDGHDKAIYLIFYSLAATNVRLHKKKFSKGGGQLTYDELKAYPRRTKTLDAQLRRLKKLFKRMPTNECSCEMTSFC